MKPRIWILLIALLCCSTAIAAPKAPSQQDVVRALRARHNTFLKRLQRLQHPKQITAHLAAIAMDLTQIYYIRGRAIIGIRHFDKTAASELYKQLLNNPKQRASLHRQALRNLSIIAPKIAIPYATKAAAHKDFTIRHLAIKVLAKQPSTASLKLLQQRTKIETNTYLKKILARNIITIKQQLIINTPKPKTTKP